MVPPEEMQHQIWVSVKEVVDAAEERLFLMLFTHQAGTDLLHHFLHLKMRDTFRKLSIHGCKCFFCQVYQLCFGVGANLSLHVCLFHVCTLAQTKDLSKTIRRFALEFIESVFQWQRSNGRYNGVQSRSSVRKLKKVKNRVT